MRLKNEEFSGTTEEMDIEHKRKLLHDIRDGIVHAAIDTCDEEERKLKSPE